MKIDDDKYTIVTGGAGFIGSALVRHLNDLGMHNLIIVDNLGSSEKWKNLVGKNFVDFVHKEAFFTWLEGREEEINAFIHLGACSSTTETDANYLLENNYRYSVKLAEYALTHSLRFIYASSAATYGDGKLGFSDAPEEMERFIPLNMYGFSKHLFDLWLKRQNLLASVVGLKFFNVFGPNEYHKGAMASALVKMVADALATGEIRLFQSSDPERFKDGEQVRDFIYVKDVVPMIAQFLTNDVSGIYNVGLGIPHTWKTLAEGVIGAIQRPVAIRYVPMPENLVGKYQNYTCADMSRYQAAGLVAPQYRLQEAVLEYVRDYLCLRNYW